MARSLRDRLIGAGRVYRTVAVLALNTLVLLVILNMGLGAQRFWRTYVSPLNDPVTKQYGERIYGLYPDLSREDVRELLHETWSRPTAFRPYVQFIERAYTGRFVNVSAAGFRHNGKEEQAWPPDPAKFNLFVLGGSTTFGYGVSDEQTIPARLQAYLSERAGREVAVYNFGQGSYYSVQERVLLEDVIGNGRAPDGVIFIDGLNDFSSDCRNGPAFSGVVRRYWDSDRSWLGSLKTAAGDLPVSRFVKRITTKPETDRSPSDAQIETWASRALERYFANEGLARAVSTRVMFVWQPVPFVKFDAAAHPLGVASDAGPREVKRGYAMFAEHGLAPDALDLSGIQPGLTGPLYIDAVHYSPAQCDAIAKEIAAAVVERGWLGEAQRK